MHHPLDPTVHRPPVRAWVWVMASALGAGSLLACGGGQKKEAQTLPPQTVAQVAPELEPPPPLPPPIREVQPTRRAAVTVIDDGDRDPQQPTTLLEASRLAKARKGEAAPPIAEINDDNLSEYAEGGQVIYMESPPAAEPPPLLDDGDDRASVPAGAGDDQVYWRRRGLELRRAWRDALDTIDDLELEAAAQRQRFYAEDDPYVRDAQVKPAWDRALDRLVELRDEALRYEEALDAYLDEGRAAGVPPGWLTEGWELEPSAEEREPSGGLETQEAVETPTTAPEARDITIDPGGGG